MRTYSGIVEASFFDYDVWLQERQEIFITDVTLKSGETWDSTFITLVEPIAGKEVATYALTANKQARIDVSDLLRSIYKSKGLGVQTNLRVVRYSFNSGTKDIAFDTTYMFYGLISPAKLSVPYVEDISELAASGQTHVFGPPRKILASPSSSPLYVHMYGIGAYLSKSTTTAIDIWKNGTVMYRLYYFNTGYRNYTSEDIAAAMRGAYEDVFGIQNAIVLPTDYSIERNQYAVYILRVYMNAAACETNNGVLLARRDAFLAYMNTALPGASASGSVYINAGTNTTGDRCIWHTSDGGYYYNTSTPPKVMSLEIENGVRAINLAKDSYGGSAYAKRLIQPLECGKDYALVEWVPAWGVSNTNHNKVATWEVRKKSVATENEVILSPQAGDNFAQIKGRAESLTLVLKGLTKSDVWYYSDIITSSRVVIHFDDYDAAVHVETSDVVMPDGSGALTDLKIKVKVVEYDAVSL